MSRVRIYVLSMLAVCAVSAVASSSASAALENHYCVNKVAIAAGEKLPVEGAVSLARLMSEVGTTKISIECMLNSVTGELEEAGKSKGEITYKQCKFYTIVKGVKEWQSTCVVATPITFPFKDQLVESANKLDEEDRFEPAVAGEPFVTIKITGCTTFLGEYKVTGTYLAALFTPEAANAAEGETENEQHEILFTPQGAGTTLKFETKPAAYVNEVTLRLASAKKWYVD